MLRQLLSRAPETQRAAWIALWPSLTHAEREHVELVLRLPSAEIIGGTLRNITANRQIEEGFKTIQEQLASFSRDQT